MTVKQKLAVAAIGVVTALACTALTLRYAPWPLGARGEQRVGLVTLPPVTIILPDSAASSPAARGQGKRHALTGGTLPDSIRVQIGAILRVPTMGIAPEPVPLSDSARAFVRASDTTPRLRRTAFGTPAVEPPRIINRTDATRLLRRIYPEELRAAPVAGTTVLRMRITEDGEVEHRYVTATSGNMLLDQAALAAVKTLRFSPARFAGQRVGADVEIPIVFRVRAGS